ncbi:hypothetical protein AB3S75_032352 [Citrus x aurantiifolia]
MRKGKNEKTFIPSQGSVRINGKRRHLSEEGPKFRDLYENQPLVNFSEQLSAESFHFQIFRFHNFFLCKFRQVSELSASKNGDDNRRLAGLAFMFSSSILLQILACAIYNNWWPMLSALMYVLVPMPCLFFGGGSTQFLISRDGGGWIDAAKFLTGASAVGSLAIPIILRHAHMIETGAMFIEFTSFFIFVCTVMCFHRASLEDDW